MKSVKVKIIDGGYILNSQGVLTNKRGRKIQEYMPNTKNRGERVEVRMVLNGTQIHFALGRLVLTTFGKPCPFIGAQVRHMDGNPWNNCIENLRWGTAKQNSDDKKRHGTHPSHPSVKAKRAKTVESSKSKKQAAHA